MIVVDASVVLETLLRTPVAPQIEKQLFAPDETLHAPHLIDVEVAQVLRRYASAGDLTPARGAAALEDLRDLPLTRYPHDMFLSRVWELRNNLTAYDAVYVALAEALDACLLTRDHRLAKAPGLKAQIECI